jgi:hypothetical protein
MAVAKTLALFVKTTITAVKRFIVQAYVKARDGSTMVKPLNTELQFWG